MAVLTQNRYGKSTVRLVAVERRTERHEIADLTIHIGLSGSFESTYLTGDNAAVLPTDTQKNTVYALAAKEGVPSPEEFALRLAQHFLDGGSDVERAQIHITEHAWDRLDERHSFTASGPATRMAAVTATRSGAFAVSGIDGLSLLNTTASEFRGFRRDRLTTLPEAADRILASRARARWTYTAGADVDYDKAYTTVRAALTEAFAGTYSRSLQQTLYAMGERALSACPQAVEISLSLSNVHHLPALIVSGLAGVVEADGRRVYLATEDPHGVIEGTVSRDGTPSAPNPTGWTAIDSWPW